MTRILVVDDDDLLRQMLTAILKEKGYEVVEAGNGEEAVKQYRRGSIDLILADVFMPKKDGIELIRELKKEFPEVKIIVVTAHTDFLGLNVLEITQKLGAARTLVKPIEQDALFSAIDEVLAS